MEELTTRLRRARDDLLALRPAVEAGEPWPLAERFGVEPEASWGPKETLAHVAEMLQFWLGEIERIVAGDDEPVPFGRVASNELRIGIIERDRTLPPRELFSRIDAGVERVAARLATFDAAAAGRRGAHPTLGEMTITRLVEHFLAAHLEEHVRQLRDTIGRTGA